MKDKKNIQPPRWAQRLLEWYCKPELLEDLQGDLNEYFQRHIKNKGRTQAKLIYIIDVFKFFRFYTIRKPQFFTLLTQWIMLASYIKTSGRSIARNGLFSTINIVGLSVSMSVGLLMIAVLMDVLSYDRFHENHDRIYRVISQYQYMNRKDNDYNASTSLKAAKEIRESIAGVEDVAVLHRNFSGDVTFGETTVPLSGLWANQSFLNVFYFPLVHGNVATALKAPFSVVLTEKTARKIFGDTDAIGKTITLNKDRAYTVTGILAESKNLSHIGFDMLASLSTRDILEKDNAGDMAWDKIWDTWVYVLLPENADLTAFKRNLDKLSEREDKTVKHTHIELALQPIDDIMTGENLSNQIRPIMGQTMFLTFGSLTLVVILSACFNYTNLSVARSFKRSREVGIRKTIGALRSHVVTQFVIESVILALIALVFAFVLFINSQAALHEPSL
jgi:putative ABC transport system permease protein